jgi:hypothetical protein
MTIDKFEIDEHLRLESEDNVDLEFCTECKNECSGKWEDFGAGWMDYGSARVKEERWAYVSTCCEAEVVKNGSLYEGPTPEEEEADRGDWLYEQWKDDQLMRKLEEEGGE